MIKIVIQESQIKDGAVEIHGYKHAMVQIISASIAFNIPVLIKNAPLVDDTFIFQEIIKSCGGICTIDGHRLFVDPRNMHISKIDSDLSKKIHGSLYLMPAFAVRFGRCLFGESGGCQIGSKTSSGKRPIEQIIDVMQQFGIKTHAVNGLLEAKRDSQPHHVVVDILKYSDEASQSTSPRISGATKTALLCAIKSKQTTILNPYTKTDVQDLVRFLHLIGFKVDFLPDSITITAPICDLKCGCIEFELTECVSEVMTYVALAVHTNINLLLKMNNVSSVKRGLHNELRLLEEMGVVLEYVPEGIFVKKVSVIRRKDIEVTNDTIQSDHHPFFALMLLKGDGPSTIRELVWKDRFAYVEELQKLGGNLIQEGNLLHIIPSSLNKGNQVLFAADTRAAAIAVLSSLTALGPTEIENIHHLHRGYENLLESIESLGVTILQEKEALV